MEQAAKVKWLISSQDSRHVVDEEGFTVADATSDSAARRIVYDHNSALAALEIYKESTCDDCGHTRSLHKPKNYLMCDVSICGCLDFIHEEKQ